MANAPIKAESKNYNATMCFKITAEKFEDGYWIITSRHIFGLFLAGKDLDKLLNDAPLAVERLMKLNYNLEVKVVIDE